MPLKCQGNIPFSGALTTTIPEHGPQIPSLLLSSVCSLLTTKYPAYTYVKEVRVYHFTFNPILEVPPHTPPRFAFSRLPNLSPMDFM